MVEFYRGAPCGYFVDIGAFDGINISNTYKLETELEWNGICIEPQEDVFERLKPRVRRFVLTLRFPANREPLLNSAKAKGATVCFPVSPGFWMVGAKRQRCEGIRQLSPLPH